MNTTIYILIMILVSFALREIPIIFFKKPIKNAFIKSFLYYMPYVTLSVMTFPSMIYMSSSPIVGIISLVIGIGSAFLGLGLFPVAILCSITVLIGEFFF